MSRPVTFYYGMCGTFKRTTIEALLDSDTLPIWSFIKPWKRWSSDTFKGIPPVSDLNFALLHLCRLGDYVNQFPNKAFLVERGVSDMLFYYLQGSERVSEKGKMFMDAIKEEEYLCERNSYLQPKKILLVQEDLSFVKDVILNEPTRKERFPDVYSYLKAQDEYVEFTASKNKITEIIKIKDAKEYIQSLGLEFKF